jgi:hypothetical protein
MTVHACAVMLCFGCPVEPLAQRLRLVLVLLCDGFATH